MTKEQRNLLQGVKIGSIVGYRTCCGYDNMGKVVDILFTNNTVILTIFNIFGKEQDIIDIEQVNSIITNKKITRYYGGY